MFEGRIQMSPLPRSHGSCDVDAVSAWWFQGSVELVAVNLEYIENPGAMAKRCHSTRRRPRGETYTSLGRRSILKLTPKSLRAVLHVRRKCHITGSVLLKIGHSWSARHRLKSLIEEAS